MKRVISCLLICFLLIPAAVSAEEEAVHFVQNAEADCFGKMVVTYDTPTLKYTIETFLMNGERCYLTH